MKRHTPIDANTHAFLEPQPIYLVGTASQDALTMLEMALIRDRPTMAEWAETKGEPGLRKFRDKWHRVSIDGFPIGKG